MSVAMERSPSLFVRDSSSEQPPGPPLRPAQDRRARHLHHHHHHHHSSRQSNTLRHHHHHHHHHHSRTNARQPARQQHQQAGSASFIDLTEEDDLVEISRSQQQQSTSQSSQASYNPRRTSQRATTPPRLARSDGTLSRVNMPELIDLTGDSPEAEQPRPRQRNSIALPRHPDDRLPAQIPDHQNPPHDALFRVNFGQHLGSFNLGNIINPRGGIGAVFNRLGQLYDIDVTRAAQNRPEPERDTPKVVLAPIPPTRSGFTRNTCAEDGNINICPCCEEELAYDRNYSAPDSSGGRKRKRAAGEHHFWAVKECGHVYCSGCFSNRMPTKASPRGAGFTVVAPKDIRCVVDDCNSKVAAKGAWTGLFASG